MIDSIGAEVTASISSRSVTKGRLRSMTLYAPRSFRRASCTCLSEAIVMIGENPDDFASCMVEECD